MPEETSMSRKLLYTEKEANKSSEMMSLAENLR